jgi:hypothetical protein
LLRLPGRQRDESLGGIETVAASVAGAVARDLDRGPAAGGPTKSARTPVPGVERHLEREDDREPAHAPRDLAHPPARHAQTCGLM